DGIVAVIHHQRREGRAEQFNRPINVTDLDLSQPAVFVVCLEDVAGYAAQHQPIVRTPIEVPLPSTVSVAFIVSRTERVLDPRADSRSDWSPRGTPCAARRARSAACSPRPA